MSCLWLASFAGIFRERLNLQSNRATSSGAASSCLATNADVRFMKQDVDIAGNSCETPGELGTQCLLGFARQDYCLERGT